MEAGDSCCTVKAVVKDEKWFQAALLARSPATVPFRTTDPDGHDAVDTGTTRSSSYTTPGVGVRGGSTGAGGGAGATGAGSQ